MRSEPEKPSVIFAKALISRSKASTSSRRRIFRISKRNVVSAIARNQVYIREPSRSFSPGKSTNNRRGIRRSTASSKSNGLFVAPITMTLSSLEDFKPSISCMNSVITPRCANAPPLSRADIRAPNSASISSRKTTHGESLRASEKTAFTSFSPSPTYCVNIVSIPKRRKQWR